MANEQNLIPLNKRTKSERRELARKAGKASGKARRYKADFKAAIQDKLDDKSMSALVEAMYKAALKGNVQAAHFLRDTIGQKPVDQVRSENRDTVEFVLIGGRENDAQGSADQTA